MALEPGTWSNLKNQAKAGYLKFDTADALAAARACADLVDDLLGMAAAVTNLRLDNVAPIGNLTSGAQLAAAFTAKGSRLRTILKDHADIVKDMGETYIAAGKAYANAEGDAGNDFRALEKLAMPTEAGQYTPGARKAGGPDAEFGKPHGGFGWKDNDGKLHVHDAKAESFPSSLKDYQGEKDPGVTANIENKDSLAFSELYELGRDLDAAPVLAAAGTWHSIANDLLSKLNTFVNAIDTGTEAWEGQGATAAAAAVEKYSEGVQPLVTSMIAMSQNLDYSAQWLYLTKLSMPSSPDPGDCCPGKVTRRYREEWQKHYGEGMKNTVSVMPVVHGPIAQPAPQGDPNRNQPGNNPPGDGRYGNGRYGNGQYGNNQYGNGQYGNGQYGNGDGQDWDDPYGYGGQQQDPRYPRSYGQADPSLEYGDGTTRSDGDTDGSGARGDRSGGSGAGGSTPLPNGASGGGSSGTQGQLPPGYEAARQEAESAAARAGGASTPVGSSGGGSADGGATRSQSGSGNPFPRSSLPGESTGSGSGSGEADVPGYSSLGSAPLPNGAKGGSFGGGGSGSGSSGSGAGGPGAGGLEDALATAFDADPAQVRSMLDALPDLLNEDALSRTSGLSPEQVRSVLENIPDVADVAELATLTGLDPAQVRSVLDNLPNALDEKALASATGTSASSTARAGLPGQTAGIDGGPASFAQAGKDFLGQIGKALTQGLGSLGELGAGSAGADQLHEMLRRFDPDAIGAAAGDLPVDPAAGAGGGGSSGGAGGGGVGSAGTLSEHPTHQARTSQMFPRASPAGAEQPMYPAAATAGPGANGMGGPPMMGPAGAGAGGGGAQGNTSHKPARYLQSKSHLDDAIGAVPDRVKPVIDS